MSNLVKIDLSHLEPLRASYPDCMHAIAFAEVLNHYGGLWEEAIQSGASLEAVLKVCTDACIQYLSLEEDPEENFKDLAARALREFSGAGFRRYLAAKLGMM